MLHDYVDQIFHLVDTLSPNHSFWKPSVTGLQSLEAHHTSSLGEYSYLSPPWELFLLLFLICQQLQAGLWRRPEYQTAWLHLLASCCGTVCSHYLLGSVCTCPEIEKLSVNFFFSFHMSDTKCLKIAVDNSSVSGPVKLKSDCLNWVRRTRTVSSPSYSAHDSQTYDPVKTTLFKSQAEKPTNH